ncbi:class I SAM-dependent methyltransferase [Paenibacillus terrigena]|uniref:class I SAM-dependent methyltransferase n=1 Tax=Paenibacillus terrigena TaxID=369333 RepID=UPI0028D8DB28|nr:class I SAM-dependent methyltransferase [Paenibacillus terrigena]
MENVIQFYETVDEEQRFKRNSRRVEFITTIHALEPLIHKSSKLLDLGAGTGSYSFYYAEKGLEVTAIDVTPGNIEKINAKKADFPHIQLDEVLGDATDLSAYTSESFDAVLCLGPYYHIVDAGARKSLIQESLRVLRPGGILAIAYINKYSVVPMLVKKLPGFIQEGTIRKVMQDDCIHGGDPEAFWTDSYYTTPDELEAYMCQFQINTIDHLGTDGLSHTISDEVDDLSDDQFQTYMKYHLETCREASILGISTHGLYICRKRAGGTHEINDVHQP